MAGKAPVIASAPVFAVLEQTMTKNDLIDLVVDLAIKQLKTNPSLGPNPPWDDDALSLIQSWATPVIEARGGKKPWFSDALSNYRHNRKQFIPARLKMIAYALARIESTLGGRPTEKSMLDRNFQKLRDEEASLRKEYENYGELPE